MVQSEKIKQTILGLVSDFAKAECMEKVKSEYQPGDKILISARNYDENELCNLVDSALTFWLTAGDYANAFENKLAMFLNVPFAYAVNSGSAANQLAVWALTSPLLAERALVRGDEVITVAAAFPTTVAPIIQTGCVPVFVDIDIPSYNIDINGMQKALSEKTKAVVVAHTLGNPFDLKQVREFCDENKLFLIEDNCDSLGAEYNMGDNYRKTGTIGDIGTSSFYPAHHITMGEGGAVYTEDGTLARIMLSMRDWGRDCSCPPGFDDSCGHRFKAQYGRLPYGYDHKYVYSHLGFNMKITEMQAAIGLAQLDKLEYFIARRRDNWRLLREFLLSAQLDEFLILPEENQGAKNSPFGFILTVRPSSPISRAVLAEALEDSGIQTRVLFAGNITRHPCFDTLIEGKDYRISDNLQNTNIVMQNSFWLGVHPGLDKMHMSHIAKVIGRIFQECQ